MSNDQIKLSLIEMGKQYSRLKGLNQLKNSTSMSTGSTIINLETLIYEESISNLTNLSREFIITPPVNFRKSKWYLPNLKKGNTKELLDRKQTLDNKLVDNLKNDDNFMISLINPYHQDYYITTIGINKKHFTTNELNQYIRIKINTINGNACPGLEDSMLLDGSDDLLRLGPFKTNMIVNTIQLVVEGFVRLGKKTGTISHMVSIKQDSYRLRIWPPEDLLKYQLDFFIINTITTHHKSKCLWTLHLINK